MAENSSKQIVCFASYFKGVEFLREAKRRGARVALITKEKNARADWPFDVLDDFATTPDEATEEQYVEIVSRLGRTRRIDHIVALEEFDVINVARLREHFRVPGISSSRVLNFRDKLVMRTKAAEAGLPAPEFVHPLRYDDVGQFMERVGPPWVLKPRTIAAAIGIKKLEEAEQVWRAIDELDARERLGERTSYWLLERYVKGSVYHVDSLVKGGEVIFAGANAYARPPLDVAQAGGVSISYTVKHGSREQRELLRLNQRVVKALGLENGAAHAEFIKSDEDGRLYFLEIAARVGGAYLAETLEAASGINLWREWAGVELDGAAYSLPEVREDYGGIVLSLARQEEPDTSSYTDPEIFYRVKKEHHVGLVVRSPEQQRVLNLLDDYTRRFERDFIAVIPPQERIE